MNVTFIVNGTEYEIKDITISDWYKIKKYAIFEDPDNSFNIVSELSGCPVENLKQLDVRDWNKLWNAVDTYIADVNTDKVESQIMVGDVLHGLVRMDKQTIGFLMDMDMMMHDPNKESKLHVIMASIYRPVTEVRSDSYDIVKYDSSDCLERSKMFLDVKMSVCVGAMSFFLNFARVSFELTRDTLVSQMKKTKGVPGMKDLPDQLELLIKRLPEAGTQFSSSWQEMTLSSLKLLQNSTSTQL